MRLASLLLLFAVITPCVRAQMVGAQVVGGFFPAPAATTGSAIVTGTILCGDNSRPARFARVSLTPAATDDAAIQSRVDAMQKQREQARSSTGDSKLPPLTDQQLAMQRASLAQQINSSAQQSNSSIADLNGRYTITGVAPGAYYVRVKYAGYADALDQFSFDQITSTDAETIKRLTLSAPRIVIIGAEEQRADVRLERGAILTGRILFDDGAPAAGWTVSALPESSLHSSPGTVPAMLNLGSQTQPPQTDDLGNFRITGLAPGSYGVRAVFNAPFTMTANGRQGRMLSMTLYSGDTFHMGDATTYALTAGATRSDISITVPLNKIRSIRGSVVAKSDGRNPNQGTISIATKDDPSFHPYTNINADGSFQLDGIPDGTYNLVASGASIIETNTTKTADGSTRTLQQNTHRYGQGSVAVVVEEADVSGVTVVVPDANAPRAVAPTQ